MSIELLLDPLLMPAGQDRVALVRNVEAEVEKLQRAALTKKDKLLVEKKEQGPPEGAQDLNSAIHWIIEVGRDPSVAPIYARSLLFAVNELVKALQSNVPVEKKDKKDKPNEGVRAKIKLFGQEIALPATTLAIEEFLKSIG